MPSITVGCTVAYDTAAGTRTGEVLETYPAHALVRVSNPLPGLPYHVPLVPLTDLRLVGDPEGMREDGCDDVDVTGRARPFHRHAVTGKAHAHPSGELAHTHQPLDVARAMSIAGSGGGNFALLAAEARRNAERPQRPDPVTVLVDALHQTLERAPAHWSSAAVLEGVRRGLAELVAGPWHLVTGQRQTGTVMHLAGGGQTPGERLIEIHEEWRP